jgi:RNA polymerase sigma factor (sigma-70 family)
MGTLFKHPNARISLDDLLAAAKSAKSCDTPAMAEILHRFEGLAIKLAGAIDAPDHLFDDLINAARMGLVNAVRHHDGRPGFPAFAKMYMQGAARRELGRWIVPEDARTNDLDDLHDHHVERDEMQAVDDRLAPWGGGTIAELVRGLDDDRRNVIELRYRWDMPVKEIAALVGTSGPAVSQRLATIHRSAERALAA